MLTDQRALTLTIFRGRSRDADTGLKWAEVLARLRAAGKGMPIKDSLIAATAFVHGLTVATRNRGDFVNAGVRVVDPFMG